MIEYINDPPIASFVDSILVLFKKRTKNISPAGLQLANNLLFLYDSIVELCNVLFKKRTKNISPAGLQLVGPVSCSVKLK
jgi:hypothetical protein